RRADALLFIRTRGRRRLRLSRLGVIGIVARIAAGLLRLRRIGALPADWRGPGGIARLVGIGRTRRNRQRSADDDRRPDPAREAAHAPLLLNRDFASPPVCPGSVAKPTRQTAPKWGGKVNRGPKRAPLPLL